MDSIYEDFLDTGCTCVTGIEIFLDPRNYTPSYGVFESTADKPINFQKFYSMVEASVNATSSADSDEDVSITTDQKLELVAQGTSLINKGYTRITPFQMNTCKAVISSVDTTWIEADAVSIVFTHSKLDESLMVPVYFKGTSTATVTIPSELLIPGDLSVTLVTLNSDGSISSTVTNSLKYTIYPTEIKPIDWGKITNFDLYYHFISTVSKLLEDFQEVEKKTKDLDTIAELQAQVNELNEKLDEFVQAGLVPYGYKDLTKIQDYLYEVSYDALDYDRAIRFLNERYSGSASGACSSCVSNHIYGRNYDWNYDDTVSFIVHTPNREGRYKVMGIAGSVPLLSKSFVESREWNDFYKYIPMLLVDGINEKGLCMNINVVPCGDFGLTTGTNPSATVSLVAPLVVRYILDHCATVAEAIECINNVNIFCPHNDKLKEEFHFMVSDGTTTKVIEFINNKVQVINCDNTTYQPIMTNFYLFNSVINHTTNEVDYTTVTDHGMGLERYNILASGLGISGTVNAMIELLDLVKYTRAYSTTQSPRWLTELVEDNLTVRKAYEQPELFEEPFRKEATKFAQRTRTDTDKTWQTVHSSVYDISNKTLYLIPQEGVESTTPIVRSL